MTPSTLAGPHPLATRDAYAGAFFSECFIDELARAAWRDPVQYRRELLPARSRLRRVLDEAARVSGWSRPLPPGHARGIALSATSGAVAAHVTEMSVDARGVSQVHRVVAVVDCGAHEPDEAARRSLESGLRAWLGGDVQAEFDLHFLPGEPLPVAVAVTEPGRGLAAAMANAWAVLRRRALSPMPAWAGAPA